jgi:hypothetical protein
VTGTTQSCWGGGPGVDIGKRSPVVEIHQGSRGFLKREVWILRRSQR